MKKIALIFVAFGIAFAVNAQTYTVVKVIGKVENPAIHRTLQIGDKVTGKDQLKFVGQDAYIVVTSAKTGNKRIAGVPDSAPREFFQLLESFIKPGKKPTSSRGFEPDYVEMLRGTMDSDTLLVLGEGRILINTVKLPLIPPAAIKVLYTVPGEKVSRKISSADGFCLSMKCVFGSSPVPTKIPKLGIFYFADEKDPTPEHLLAAFTPLYLNEDELLKEIQAVARFVGEEKKEASVYREIYDYLTTEYAKVQEDNLKAWLVQKGVQIK